MRQAGAAARFDDRRAHRRGFSLSALFQAPTLRGRLLLLVAASVIPAMVLVGMAGLAIPESASTGPLHSTLWRFALLGLVLLVAGLAAALVIARDVVRALRRLAAPAEEGSRRSGIREVDELATILARAAAEVRASEARVQATFDEAAVAIAHLALDGRFLRVNERLCAMLGYARADLVGKNVQDITHSDDVEPDMEQVRRMLTGEIATSVRQRRYFHRNGTIIWVSLTVSLVRRLDDTPKFFISVVENISERKKAENAARVSEARRQSLLETLDLATLMVRDVDGTIRFWSDGCRQLYGWTAEQAVGRSTHDLLRTTFPVPQPEIEAALLRDGTWSGDLIHHRRDGTALTVAVRKVVRRDADGRALAVIESIVDVSALRRAQAALECLNRSLEARVGEEVAARQAAQERLVHAERMQALGQLAGGIAHDFNNVLQAVQGGATLIERRPANADNVRRYARLVLDAAGRGASITRRLLAFARRGDMHAEAMDAGAVLSGMRDIMAHTLGAGINIRLDLAPGLPPLRADRGQLETALVNLATNARDSMPTGGTLRFAAAPDIVAPDSEHRANLGAGAYVRIAVSDTGAGMDRATLAQVLEPFFTTKPQGQGTGLGLAMVKGFAEQSGGGLVIDSAPGAGTTVTLWLPQAGAGARPEVPAPEEDGLDSDVAARTVRVLLVDDDPLVRETLAMQLDAGGCDVLAAASGMDALALLDAGEMVDVLVTDLSMPGMDGLAVMKGAQQRRPNLPALLLTGYAGDNAGLAVSGALSGRFSLLRKPISGAMLVDRVAALMAARAGAGA